MKSKISKIDWKSFMVALLITMSVPIVGLYHDVVSLREEVAVKEKEFRDMESKYYTVRGQYWDYMEDSNQVDIGPTKFELVSNDFRLTYYCSCEQCCGDYASSRPVYEGKELVLTSSGALATSGLTVAADPGVLPAGTVIYIEGIGFRVVQDTGNPEVVKGNIIDIYVDSHEDGIALIDAVEGYGVVYKVS